jgi:CTP synthase
VKQLLELGVQPDILVCRTEHHLTPSIRTKLAQFCNVSHDSVIESIDAETIYDVPLLMQEERLDEVVLSKLDVDLSKVDKPNLTEWKNFLYRFKNPDQTVHIGLVGKYVELKDSYKSIAEALAHAGANLKTRVEIHWIHSEQISKKNVQEKLGDLNGILVAPGFGSRGIDGKLESINFARTNDIPFFGICLGMQMAIVEFARNVAGLKEASSGEFRPNHAQNVIDLMPEQRGKQETGGTMRLGAYKAELVVRSKIARIYKTTRISERHRHRYEVMNEFVPKLEKAGLVFSGRNPERDLVETIELPEHPWFIGCQYHPELQSKPLKPHPLFAAFIAAAHKHRASRQGQLSSTETLKTAHA